MSGPQINKFISIFILSQGWICILVNSSWIFHEYLVGYKLKALFRSFNSKWENVSCLKLTEIYPFDLFITILLYQHILFSAKKYFKILVLILKTTQRFIRNF